MTTGQQIWDLALDYFDDAGEGLANTNFELRHVNIALSEIHQIITNAKHEDYFRSEDTITLVAGTEGYNLPSDFYAANSVYYLQGTGSNTVRWPIQKWHPIEVGGFRASPMSAGSVALFYTPKFTDLSLISDNIDTLYAPGWEDYAAIQIAIRLCIKEGNDKSYQMLDMERKKKYQQIVEAVSGPRDMGEPDSIGDYQAMYRHRYYRGHASSLMYRVQGTKIYFIENDLRGV